MIAKIKSFLNERTDALIHFIAIGLITAGVAIMSPSKALITAGALLLIDIYCSRILKR
jgi:hypothetical protein